MNVENIKRVRDHIAGLPASKFDLDRWPALAITKECGTAACIGGWAEVVLFPDDGAIRDSGTVGEKMGLTLLQAGALFFPAPMINRATRKYQATIPQAVAVLDHLLETGEVDWSVAEGVA